MGEFRVAFYPRNFDASTQFYRDGLGFEALAAWDRPGDRGLLLAAEGGIIELLSPPPDGTHLDRPGLLLSIEVDDVEARYEQLRDAGVDSSVGPALQPWGHRSFTVHDPDGIGITFFEIIEN